jgi:hypothetical protein
MAIRKPISISWEGVEHKIIVSMSLIERIDNDVNILSLARMSKETISIVKISKLIYILLEESGKSITWDEVYEGFGDQDKIKTTDLFGVIGEIMPMLLPSFNGVAKKKPKRRTKKKK